MTELRNQQPAAPAASEGGKGTRPDADKITKHVFDKWGPLLSRPEMADDYKAPVASVEGQRTQPEEFPVELNKEQLASIEEWSKNSMVGDIWSNAQARKHNLTIFARKIMSDARTSSDNSASVPDVEGMGARESEPPQLERIRDFINMVTGWTAKYPLKGEASKEDTDASLIIYGCCEGADDNLYELRQLWQAARSLGGAGREQELERAREARKHTQDWYALHYGKVEDWARKILPEPWRTQYFNCVANGTYDHTEDVGESYMSVGAGMITPSGYFRMETAAEQLMRDQTERAEAAESRNEKLVACLRRLVESDGHSINPPCAFTGCTCGGTERYRVARDEACRILRSESLLSSITEKGSTT